MNRRSFLRWFGAVAAVSAVAPATLPKIAEAMRPLASGGVTAAVPTLIGENGCELIVTLEAYDRASAKLREAQVLLMLMEDRRIMFGGAST